MKGKLSIVIIYIYIYFYIFIYIFIYIVNELEINLEKDQMSGNNNLEEQIDQTTRYEYIEETEGGINEDNLESIQKDGLNEEELISPSSGEFYLYLGICFALTIMAAVMSGLTVGYLSIDELVLEMKMKSGTEQDRKRVIALSIVYI